MRYYVLLLTRSAPPSEAPGQDVPLTITNDVKDGSNGNRQKERGKVEPTAERPRLDHRLEAVNHRSVLEARMRRSTTSKWTHDPTSPFPPFFKRP